MGENMQDIKRRIKSVSSTMQITNAMKLVSAAKLRKARATFEKTTEYFNFITHTIEEIFNNNSEVPPEYLAGNREIKNWLATTARTLPSTSARASFTMAGRRM